MFQETQRLKQEPVPGISADPDDSNARYFHVIVQGPSDVCIFIIPNYNWLNIGNSVLDRWPLIVIWS